MYASLDDATGAGPIRTTSQIALPQSTCAQVYAIDGYDGSAGNLAGSSLDGDMVFGDDGGEHQLAAVTGNTEQGYTAALTIAV